MSPMASHKLKKKLTPGGRKSATLNSLTGTRNSLFELDKRNCIGLGSFV